MRYDPDSLAMQELNKCANHLENLCNTYDQDETNKWFNLQVENAEKYIAYLYENGIIQEEI